MATTNKALTTYLPDASVKWLETYCLEYKHLLNKDGNPKLGTALADIVSRLVDGELTLPLKIDSPSTVPGTLQYDRDLSELKSEVDELKKLLDRYSKSNVPSTVPDSIGLDEVNNIIDRKMESLAVKSTDTSEIEPLAVRLAELETYSQTHFKEVLEEVQALRERLVTTDSTAQIEALKAEIEELKKHGRDRVVETTDSIAQAHPLGVVASNQKPKPNIDSTTTQRLTWTKFFNTVGMEALTATEAQKEENIADRTEQIARGIQAAKEQGLGEWVVKVAGRSFVALLATLRVNLG
jgi:hypothetical protein